jgi:hypothetical protein
MSGGSQKAPMNPLPPRLKILQAEISGFSNILMVDVQKKVVVSTVHVKTTPLRFMVYVFYTQMGLLFPKPIWDQDKYNKQVKNLFYFQLFQK